MSACAPRWTSSSPSRPARRTSSRSTGATSSRLRRISRYWARAMAAPAHTIIRSGLLGGLDMIRSGHTACYDLMHEFPLPTAEGLAAVARGYNEAGVRVVLAPMVADHSFFEAIPGLMDALPPSLARAVERFRLAPAETALAALRGIAAGWGGDRLRAPLALAPTIPLHCSDGFITGCGALAREYGTALQMHLAESRIQAVSGMRRYGKTLTAP